MGGGRPGSHADGFRWLKNVTSSHPSHTLEDPDGHWVAHAYRCNDGTWAVCDGDGPLVVSGLATAGQGLRLADNRWRPCAYDHGLPDGLCGNERSEGSLYCQPHAEQVERDNAASDAMDRRHTDAEARDRANPGQGDAPMTAAGERCRRCGNEVNEQDRQHRLYLPGECVPCISDDIAEEARWKRLTDV